MSISHLFNITVDIHRPTMTAGSYGEPIKTYAMLAVGDNIPFRLQKLKSNDDDERIWADKETVWADYVGFCDALVTVAATDRVIYGSRTFEVRSVDNVNQMDILKRIELLEIA